MKLHFLVVHNRLPTVFKYNSLNSEILALGHYLLTVRKEIPNIRNTLYW